VSLAHGSVAGQGGFHLQATTSWEDPLSFRILTILPYCYRCWAKLRLRHLSPWIQSWATEDMFAVKAGKGADAAWYRSAVLSEEALMMAKPFSGACDDIWKAYDSVSRETAIVAAMTAGFPSRIARTYLFLPQQSCGPSLFGPGPWGPKEALFGHTARLPMEQHVVGEPPHATASSLACRRCHPAVIGG
jgi:hypothetical protein